MQRCRIKFNRRPCRNKKHLSLSRIITAGLPVDVLLTPQNEHQIRRCNIDFRRPMVLERIQFSIKAAAVTKFNRQFAEDHIP